MLMGPQSQSFWTYCWKNVIAFCIHEESNHTILCTLQVGILDDDIFEEDEHFFVHLQKLRVEEGENEGAGTPPKGRLVEPLVATITILDDDHAGIFTFGQRVLRVSESTGTLMVTVVRNSGSRGTVAVPYHTEDGSAKAGVDYEENRGELEFTNEQTRWGNDWQIQ